jgi:signal peptidase I
VRRRDLSRLVWGTETVILTVFVTVAFQTFVTQPFRVEHESMLDTLRDGEMILVDRLTPRLTGLHRGDIVIFDAPADYGPSAPFIKRVIGLPGDVIDLVGGVVTVDGVPLDESGYVYRDQGTYPMGDGSHWVVAPGELFVLGDHRADSTDSRTAAIGEVPQDRVIGRAFVRYWPPSDFGFLDAPAYPELRSARVP